MNWEEEEGVWLEGQKKKFLANPRDGTPQSLPAIKLHLMHKPAHIEFLIVS